MRATVRNGGHTEWRGGPISLGRMFHFLSKPSPCSAYVAVRRVGRLSKYTPLHSSRDHRSSIFSLEGGLANLPLRVSNEGLPNSLYLSPEGVAKAALYCAHRASTFLLRALRARRTPGRSFPTLFPPISTRPPSEPSEVPTEAPLSRSPILAFLNPSVRMPKIGTADPPEEREGPDAGKDGDPETQASEMWV